MVPLRRHKVDLFVSCAYDIVVCAGKHMVLALHSALRGRELIHDFCNLGRFISN